jgi:hypothetical protein
MTTYGGNYTNEVVLTRIADIPAIINAQNITLRDNAIQTPQGMNEEGTLIVLDGDNNRVFISLGNAVDLSEIVEDISFGIDILEFKTAVTSPYINPDGSFRKNVSNEMLLEANCLAWQEFKANLEKGDEREKFLSNLKKHFLHQLLIQMGISIGKTPQEIERDFLQHLEKVEKEAALDAEIKALLEKDDVPVRVIINECLHIIQGLYKRLCDAFKYEDEEISTLFGKILAIKLGEVVEAIWSGKGEGSVGIWGKYHPGAFNPYVDVLIISWEITGGRVVIQYRYSWQHFSGQEAQRTGSFSVRL